MFLDHHDIFISISHFPQKASFGITFFRVAPIIIQELGLLKKVNIEFDEVTALRGLLVWRGLATIVFIFLAF